MSGVRKRGSIHKENMNRKNVGVLSDSQMKHGVIVVYPD